VDLIMSFHELFPTVVGEYKLDRNFTEEEVENLYSVNEIVKNIGNLISVQSNVLDLDGFSEIKKFILDKVHDYIQFVYKPKYDVECYITQSWLNYTEHQQWHHRHNHVNSFLSGVFYISSEKELDRIKFFNDSYDQISIFSENYNRLNSDTWDFRVGSRDLFIFPSKLSHMVEPTENENLRVSLSFNTFIKGTLGSCEYMTELNLQ
jgi:uncharacterized protein (TIGR02466 family)